MTQGTQIVRGLKQQDFLVTDNGQPQSIVSFSHGNEPLSLILLLDVSGSMQKYLGQIAGTAREALGFLRPADRVAIMVFGKTSAVHQDFSDNLAETARQISSAIHDHDVGAGTAINQAVLDAAHFMDKQAGAGGRRAILILTDNLSLSYMLPDNKVIRALDDADTTLDAIVVGRAIPPAPPAPGHYTNPDFTPANVFKLAEETGGLAIKSDRADVTFRDMVERIRLRYMLAYHAPQSAQPGSFRHIHVELTPEARAFYPAAEVHARTGYWVK